MKIKSKFARKFNETLNSNDFNQVYMAKHFMFKT